jgi:hypothetical protein
MLEAVSNDGGGLLRGDKYHRKKACQDITFPLKIELNDASIRIYSMKSYGCPNFVRIFRDKTQSGENLIVFGGQKCWIFLAVLGSPGKVGNNRTLEVVGSTPIGSTNFFNILGE